MQMCLRKWILFNKKIVYIWSSLVNTVSLFMKIIWFCFPKFSKVFLSVWNDCYQSVDMTIRTSGTKRLLFMSSDIEVFPCLKERTKYRHNLLHQAGGVCIGLKRPVAANHLSKVINRYKGPDMLAKISMFAPEKHTLVNGLKFNNILIHLPCLILLLMDVMFLINVFCPLKIYCQGYILWKYYMVKVPQWFWWDFCCLLRNRQVWHKIHIIEFVYDRETKI